MVPAEAREILLYYGGAIVLALLLFIFAGRKKRGMRLKLKGSPRAQAMGAGRENVFSISGEQTQSAEKFSHIQQGGERPLNVIFNYNGHSWDAYEVLGLPAGSSPEKVELTYREALKSVDRGSRSFLEAAFHAIQSEWKAYLESKERSG